MKKFFSVIITLFLATSVFANSDTTINKYAVFSFDQNFPLATHARWMANGPYDQVDFAVNGIRCQLLKRSDDGSFFRIIKYYDAGNIKPAIREKLQHYYKDKTILGVTEVRYENGTIYQANLKGKKHLYIVYIDPYGNVELQNRFNKQNSQS